MNKPEMLPAYGTETARRNLTAPLENMAAGAAPTIAAYIRMLRARKWLIALLTLLAVVLAAFFVNLATPIYRATTMMKLEDGKQKIVSIEQLYSGDIGNNRENVQTQTAFIRSRDVTGRVVTSLELDKHPAFDPRQAEPSELLARLQELAWLEPVMPYITPLLTPRVPTELIDQDLVISSAQAKIQRNLSINPIRQSQLIEISYEDANPALAAEIANTTADQFIRADLDSRFEMHSEASTWLSGRLDELKISLDQSEATLQKFREDSGIIATPDSMGGTISQLETASGRLIQARIARAQAAQVFRQVRRGAANRYQVPAVFNNAIVIEARQEEARAEANVNELAQNLGAAHPLYLKAKAELTNAQGYTRAQSEAVIASIAKEFEVARSTEKAIEQELANSRGNIQDLNRSQGSLNALEREVSTNRRLYETFLSRVKETDATADFQNPVARIVDEAIVPTFPVKPRKALIVLLAALGGGLLASALAISLEIQSSVLRSSDDVAEKLGAELLAAVPKAKRNQKSTLAIIQHQDSRSLIAEAVRTAMTGIRLATHGEKCPIIAFTSSVPGEGKSTLAINAAIEAGRTKKVLLVDADLRKPSLAEYLNLPDDGPGLTDIIAGAPIEICLNHSEDLRVSVIRAGTARQNPLDQLMSMEFRDMLETLQERYDMIIIDTPPVELVSDALPIGKVASGMVYVAKANETPIGMIRRGLSRLESADVHVMGVILNAHDFEKASKYYGEESAYGSYGAYGYHSGTDGRA